MINNSNNREKGKLSLSLMKWENLGWIDTIITCRKGIILSSRYQVTIKWLELYSESPCIKSWKMLRTSPSSNGPIRWWETLKRETEIFIVNSIETMVTLPRTVEVYGITLTNLSEKVNWNSCCIIPAVWVFRLILYWKGRILQDPLLELSTLSLRRLAERVMPLQSNVRGSPVPRGWFPRAEES